ncbi:EF-hand domain-containing protein, partial [Rhizobium ruizarguesonis]
MTSVSSLGRSLTQYQSPLSSLDKNGDGVLSADELAR